MQTGGQTGEIGHLPARHKADRHSFRQAEQLSQPLPRYLFHDARRRAQNVEASVLVPGRRQPVGCQRRWVRAANHKAKESPAAGGDHSWIRSCDEISHYLSGIHWPFWHGATQSRSKRRELDRTRDRTRRQVL